MQGWGFHRSGVAPSFSTGGRAGASQDRGVGTVWAKRVLVTLSLGGVVPGKARRPFLYCLPDRACRHHCVVVFFASLIINLRLLRLLPESKGGCFTLLAGWLSLYSGPQLLIREEPTTMKSLFARLDATWVTSFTVQWNGVRSPLHSERINVSSWLWQAFWLFTDSKSSRALGSRRTRVSD